MKAIIVEDELEGMRNLVLKLEKSCPHVEVIAKCDNGKDAVNAIRQHRPDLVFLDIDLGELSGFDVLDKVQQIPFELIFITAHEQYARQAVKTNAVDYILKPFRISELEDAVATAADRIRIAGKIPRILVPDRGAVRVIRTNDIQYCLADNVWTKIYYTRNGQKFIVVAKTLGMIYDMLPKDQFHRISRQAVVNLEFVDKIYNHARNSYLVLQNEAKDELGITNSRMGELMRKLGRG